MIDENALLEAVTEHDGALRRISWAYAGEYGEEEDLYQEILAEAWRSLPRFRGEAAIGTWLYRVAINTALTWQRRARKRLTSRVRWDSLGEAESGITHGSVATGDAEARLLAAFLDSLTGANHTVLLLYMEGLSHQEIADVTGLSVGAIGVRIHRMKRSFTERYLEG